MFVFLSFFIWEPFVIETLNITGRFKEATVNRIGYSFVGKHQLNAFRKIS